MKHGLMVALLTALLATVGVAGAKDAPPDSKGVAVAYFVALTSGDTNSANAVIAVPYACDGKEILRTREAVEKLHSDILVNKGKRKVPEYTVSTPRNAAALDRKVFPDYEVFRIAIAGSDEHVDIYVSKGKVVGFRD